MTCRSKAETRREILAKRDTLSQDERHVKSLAIADKLVAQPEYMQAGSVLFYINFRSEVGTRAVMGAALKEGKKVFVPKVDRRTRMLRLYEITDMARDLEAGYMGIYEPVEGIARTARPDEVDLVIMPGVGFDGQGRRLGYGGGYFDKLIETLRPGVGLVALAFDVQVVDEIPSEPHDKKVGKIITETRVIAA